MTPTATASPAQAWLVKGQQALREGNRLQALDALQRAVAADPAHIESLLWLAANCEDPQDSLRYLTRVLALEPHNEAAHHGIRWTRKRLAQSDSPLYAAPPTFPRPADLTAVSDGGRRTTIPAHYLQFTIAMCLLAAVVLGGLIILIQQWPPAPVVVASSNSPPIAAEPTATMLPETPPPAQVAPTAIPTVNYAERADKILRELDGVWASRDWERAVELTAQAVAFQPQDKSLRHKLMSAYFNYAVALLDEGNPERALWAFDQALEVEPNEPEVVVERTALANYLAGLAQYNQRNWTAAAQSLAKVYSTDAGYLDTRELLYRSYYYQGLALKEKKDLQGALKAFQAAVDMDNEAVEARGELAQVKAALQPPPPPPPGAGGEKWIDVNLTTQRMRVYQGQTVVYSFVVSTGEPGRPTRPGRYQILDKIPMAYSRFWNLWMPNWMGIYWAGASENGIHALPILKSGQTLWSGFLGRRISFGCVVLDTNAAKTLYNWAEIGTPVIIHY